MQNLELQILDSLSAIRNPWMDWLMVFFSALSNHGEIWIVIGLLSMLYYFAQTRKSTIHTLPPVIERYVRHERVKRNGRIDNVGLSVLLALLFSFIITNQVLKPLVERIRPYEFRQVQLLVKELHDYSFPSGHTSASFAAATAIWRHNRKWGTTALGLASIIAFSRLYLYVHFPTDVLGGIAVGIFCGFLANWLVIRQSGN